MKKIISALIFFAFVANVPAQLKVDASGNVGIGSVLGTISDNPITFKVNGSLAGFTGFGTNGNVSFGYGAMISTSTNTYNTACGSYALFKNTSGISNTANGYYTLTNNNGNGNTASGSNALVNNLSGGYNTANGFLALTNNTTGSYNTAIGYAAGANSPNNLSNSTAIGNGAFATSSNQIVIGNVSIEKIGGYVNWYNFSDGRGKKNIRADVPGLNFINGLQPVTYNLDLDAVDNLLGIDKAKRDGQEKDMTQDMKDRNDKARKAKENMVETGFIAQDVEKTAKSIGYKFSGVNVDESGIYSLSYAEFVVPLVKAVQELSSQNNRLQDQVDELTGLVNKLLGKDSESKISKSASNNSSLTGLTTLAVSAQASLEQNAPNPFNHSTVIRYNLPETCTSAKILITNTGGNVIQQLPLSVSDGTNSITVKGHSLSAGVYLYTLICDGKTVDTKRMVLTK